MPNLPDLPLDVVFHIFDFTECLSLEQRILLKIDTWLDRELFAMLYRGSHHLVEAPPPSYGGPSDAESSSDAD